MLVFVVLLLFPLLMAYSAASDLLTMTISNRVSIALVLGFAGVALADGRDDAAFQALSALSMGIRAARNNAGTNIQVHGGIGFSDEADPHMLLKAAHLWETIVGGEEAVHAALVGEASPLDAAVPARH